MERNVTPGQCPHTCTRTGAGEALDVNAATQALFQGDKDGSSGPSSHVPLLRHPAVTAWSSWLGAAVLAHRRGRMAPVPESRKRTPPHPSLSCRSTPWAGHSNSGIGLPLRLRLDGTLAARPDSRGDRSTKAAASAGRLRVGATAAERKDAGASAKRRFDSGSLHHSPAPPKGAETRGRVPDTRPGREPYSENNERARGVQVNAITADLGARSGSTSAGSYRQASLCMPGVRSIKTEAARPTAENGRSGAAGSPSAGSFADGRSLATSGSLHNTEEASGEPAPLASIQL